MTVFMVPELEDEPYPTLGLQVAQWIEDNLVFGPGDLRGEPCRLDDEKRGLIARMYELYPAGHPQAGRRRFRRCAISVRKGVGKTELAAWVAAAELHPDAPVRFDGWDGHGNPIGRGVTDPYIPCVATTEEQSDELAYNALRTIIGESRVAGDFDIGLARIMRRKGDGKAVSLATSPDSRDGARTTFELCDETHRWVLPRLKEAHRVMLANLPKRKMADPWMLEVTTAPAPGEGSVAEDTMEYARQVEAGKIHDSRLFFFHRQASDNHDLTTPDGVRAAVLEASGPVAVWSDIDGIVEQWQDPTTDKSYLERVWLNRLVRSSKRAFDAEQWKALAKVDYQVADGALITLGFDGARFHDSTALVGTEITSGYQWLIGLWERPEHARDNWEVDASLVDAAVGEAFRRYDVWRLYADPPYWDNQVDIWSGRHGEKRVIKWYTNRYRQMAYAVRAFGEAIQTAALSHDGSPGLRRHIGNACRRVLAEKDDQGKPLWIIQKERPDSPHKMDGAMCACLSWEARGDALAAGVGQGYRSLYEDPNEAAM